jgi:hypothetical protein
MIKYALILSTLLLAGCSHPNLGQANHLLPGGSTYLAEASRLEARAEWASAAAAVNVAGDNQAVAAGVDVGELWSALEDRDGQRLWALAFDFIKGAAYSYALYTLAEDHFGSEGVSRATAAAATPESDLRPSIRATNGSEVTIRDADIVPNVTADGSSVVLIDMSVDATISRHATFSGLSE